MLKEIEKKLKKAFDLKKKANKLLDEVYDAEEKEVTFLTGFVIKI